MSNKALAAVAVLTLSLSGCGNEGSSTAPSNAPSAVAPGELGLVSSRNLENPGPVCVGARTPGFYCQNQGEDSKNPNLAPGEFDSLETEAAGLLGAALGGLTVGEAVCIKGNKAPEDQLVRHLAALALNLAANLIDETTPITDGSFATVGDAFAEAIATASDAGATKQERNAIKDVLDAINNNQNIELGEDCVDDGDEEEPDGE